MTKRTKRKSSGKRGTYITPRAAVSRTLPRDYWPRTHLTPLRSARSYTPTLIPNYRERQRPLGVAQLTRRPRRLSRTVSGMHDTPFKRPTISPYGVWQKGLRYLQTPLVKVCVQRKQRREAVFATTGGGSIRRKPNNQRTLRSQIGCK